MMAKKAPNPIDRHVGSRVRMRRMMLSMSQEKLGDALGREEGMREAPPPAHLSDFLATSDGLALTKAFMRIGNAKLRRRIVDLVEQIAGED